MKKRENMDYNPNRVHIYIAVIIVIFGIVFGSILIIHKKNSANDINVEENSERRIADYNTFYSIQTIVNNFVFASSNEKVYKMLDEVYIEKNNIDENNAIYISKNGNTNLNFKAQKINKPEINNANKNIYIVEGILISNTFGGVDIIDKNYKIVVLIDYNNLTFSIYPDIDDISKEFADREKIVIEKNDYNSMPTNKVKTSYEVCSSYYNDFTFKVEYMIDDAYNLLDKTTQTKYTKEYIKNNFSGYSSISNCSFVSDKHIYIVKDKNNNELQFTEKNVMDYTVYIE